MTVDLLWTEQEFMRSLQALAMPFDTQIHIFPDGVCIPCELVIDYLHFSDAYVESNRQNLTRRQTLAVTKLADKIEELTETADYECWKTDPLRISPAWDEIRSISSSVLVEFNWPVQEPAPR